MKKIKEQKIQVLQQLRAISILLVLMYHMGLPVESGFLGVDLFFFISGYVVTSVLENKYLGTRSSLKEFYKNRFWRLFPVLVFSMLFTFALSIIFQTAHEISTISKHIVYAFSGVSNLIYYRESGIYGTSSTENNPLIHLWSLSVEFQFYLIFPVVYAAIYRIKRSKKVLLLFIVLVSSIALQPFTLSALNLDEKISNSNMFYFYLTPFRLYEFLFGVFAYNLVKLLNIEWNRISKFIFVISVLAITSIFLNISISDSNKYIKTVSLMALLVLFIVSTSNRPRSESWFLESLEKFGKYAYSLYLIHLPIITLAHIHFPSNKFVPLLAGLIAIPLSFWVSNNIEYKQITFRNKAIIFKQLAALFSIILIFPILPFAQKNSSHQEISTNKFLEFYMQSGCTPEVPMGSYKCAWNFFNFDKTVFVVGDSQASFSLDAIVPAAVNNSIRVVSGARYGCPFIAEEVFSFNQSKCAETRNEARLWIKNNAPDYVVIANLSTGYLTTSRKTVSNPGGKCPNINGMGCKGYELALEKTINEIQKYGSKVILLHTIPNFTNQYNRNLFDFYPSFNIKKDSLILAREPSFIAEMNIAKRNVDLQTVDPFNYLCDFDSCPIKFEGESLYFDPIHISTFGAKLLEPKFNEIFSKKASPNAN